VTTADSRRAHSDSAFTAWKNLIAGTAFVLIGGLLLTGAAMDAYDRALLRSDGVDVTATVLEVHELRRKRVVVEYVVAFELRGEEHRARVRGEQRAARAAPGDSLTVRVLPTKPSEAKIPGEEAFAKLAMLFFMGMVFTGAGAYGVWRGVQTLRRGPNKPGLRRRSP
jgi:hypothetical protein